MMQRKSTRHRAFDPDPNAPNVCCDMPGCTERAGYRAPKSRDSLSQYFWFCLMHVREYNAKWDYYKGMTPGQIEAHLRADVSWQRPSWKLGERGGKTFDEEEVLDPLDILGAGRARRAQAARERESQRRHSKYAPEPLRQPLSTLGLEWPVSMDDLKTRYKNLARQHHPDANGGDPASEERFKAVNVAYTVVRAHLSAHMEKAS
ncbi:J domain-containing protein [Kozakia baliensis]|uniref:J domain-containing protein n=1 Tax=Kozakia baliensis TaxID=153496 RepID=UPI0004958A60